MAIFDTFFTRSTVTGLTDNDYPNLDTMKLSSQLKSIQMNTIPIPTGVLDQVNHMQSNCDMGIFVDIKRAWLTIDSNIFLWNYENGTDVAYFDGLTETILGVSLIRPKADIFKPYIKYLLVLTTSVEIVILGVTYTEEEESTESINIVSKQEISDLLLVPEPLFSLPTDNVVMNVVNGTKNGRIFLGSKNGSIFEVIYNSNDSWFSSKCYKVNHSSSALTSLIPSFLSIGSVDPIVQIVIDDCRNILYTRSESGSIDVWDLGTNGSEMSAVTNKSLSVIVSAASYLAPTIDVSYFKPIVSICTIESDESSAVTLVAVTESGLRLYFSTTHGSFGTDANRYVRPSTLQLVHIRLPPGFSASSGIGKPLRVHMSSYRQGITLFVSIASEDTDTLVLLSNDTFGSSPDLMEVSSVVNLSSRVWRLVEEPRTLIGSEIRKIDTSSLKRPVGFPTLNFDLSPMNIVGSDSMDTQRKFVLLTSAGVHILSKPRPIDHLRQLLVDNQGVDNDCIKEFFSLFGDLRASVTCINLACSERSPMDKMVAEWSTLAFHKFSSDIPPTPIVQQVASPTMFVSTPAHGQQSQQQLATHGQFSPVGGQFPSTSGHFSMTQGQTPGQQQQVSAVEQQQQFSVRHNSLYQYLYQIVSPFWDMPAVLYSTNQTESGLIECITSSVPLRVLLVHISKLTNFKNFLVKNVSTNVSNRSHNLLGTPLQSHHGQQNTAMSLTQSRERESLDNLIRIINNCLEVLNLWKILLDHQFHTISTLLASTTIGTLKSMAFKDVILSISGQEICSTLASALIQRYIEDNSTTDAISKRLIESCPSIFKSENALTAKAHEKIMKAKSIMIQSLASDTFESSRTVQNEQLNERRQLISEAVNLLSKIGDCINLGQAVELLIQVNAFKEIIDLCLKTAHDRDPNNIASAFYKSNHQNLILMNNPNQGFNADYHRGLSRYQIRIDCYNTMMSAYDKLVSKCSETMPMNRSPKNVSKNEQIFGAKNLGAKNFDELTKEDAEELSAEFLNYLSGKSCDELSHVALYDYLFHHKKHDKLLSIKSPYLEEYLKRKTQLATSIDGGGFDSHTLMDLLWMFYERNGHFRAAAEILSKLSEKSGSNIDLYQRMEYLARAIVCLKSSTTGSGSSFGGGGVKSTIVGGANTKSSGELLHEMEEKMDVARIQLQLLESIRSLPRSDANANNQLIVSRLNGDLLDITACYEIAEKLSLAEHQLAIIFSANHFDPGLVEKFWKSILDKLMAECSNKNEQSIIAMIESKLVNLGNLYLPSEKYFPIDFIVSYLESKCSSRLHSLESNWLISILINGLNIPITNLLTIYHKLYKSKGSQYSWPGKDIQMLTILSHLISQFASNPQLVSRNERRPLVTKCLDVISGYLLDLQNIPTNDGKRLITEFKMIQNQLNNFT